MRRSMLLLLVACWGCATSAPAPLLATLHSPGLVGLESPTVARLRQLTLLRDREGLRASLGAADPALRTEAALGLGRAGAPADRAVLAPLLSDPSGAVREAAAVSLGLLGLSWDEPDPAAREELSAALAAQASKEQLAGPLRAMAWALGRAGGPASAPALGALLAHPDPAVRAEAGFALGVLARFHAPQEREPLARAAAALVRDPDASARAGAAFALLYLEDPAQAQTQAALARDGDPTVRAFAARGLGTAAEEPSLLEALTGDPDLRVRVEAVRGLQTALQRQLSGGAPSKTKRPGDVAASTPAGGPTKAQVAAARPFAAALERVAAALGRAAAAGSPLAAQPLELLLRPGTGATPEAAVRAALGSLGELAAADPGVREDLGRLHCLAAAALDRATGRDEALPGCGGGVVPREVIERLEAALLGELAARPDAPASVAARLDLLARSGAPSVRMEALSALGKLSAGQGQAAVLAALTDPDAAVREAAAEAAGHLRLVEATSSLLLALPRSAGAGDAEGAQAIVTALGELPADPARTGALRAALSDRRPSVRLAATAAFAKVTSEGEAAAAVASARVPAPELPLAPDLTDPRRTLRLTTAKGIILARLDFERAPVAAENLRSLARKGLLDGTPFHRLEPGFVVQGGDPRGDGTGGPGHAIPCEPSRTPYLRGTLGMALSGKDTGGSQFFFTFGRTPHLEGRYTAFGLVVSGMEVVDRLLAGDRIVTATVE